MATNQDYIKWIRSKAGHGKIILIFAGGCIFNDLGEVLLQHRGDSNKWGFPSGAVELGETPEQTAKREVKEETGLEVESNGLIGIYTGCNMEYSNGDIAHSIIIAYRLTPIGGSLKCDNVETLELKWFPLSGLPPLFCKQHEELARDLL